MLSERQVSIVETATGNLAAGVVRPATQSDKVLWTHWHGEFWAGDEDADWEWDEYIDLAFAMPDRFEVYALECANELQGLRMLEVSENDVKAYGVHALRLSSAPWNRPPDRRHSGVGSILLAVAILRSIELGHRGRVHCESLKDAEGFHERNGMTPIDGLSNEGLRRFRFTEQAATDFLERLQLDGLMS